MTDTGYYTFYTASDDGSTLARSNAPRFYSTSGVPDSVQGTELVGSVPTSATIGEQLVSNDFSQGVTTRSSAPILLAAGLYAIRIAANNGGGGGGASASWAETPEAGVSTTAGFAQQVIPASAFTYTSVINNVISNSTGLVRLSGHDTYNGTTTVNSGTLEIDGADSNTTAVNVSNATLAGVGTISAPVSIGAGGILSPGTNAGTATGILTVGSLNFASSSPTPALNITINGSVVGTEYDQVVVNGTTPAVSINSALLNLSIGSTVNNDSPTNTTFTFIDIAGSSLAVGGFAGHAFGSTITAGGDSFALKNSIVADEKMRMRDDVGLILQPSNNYFVSSTWTGDTSGTNVTDAVLTDGQAATFGTNAFATIQDAINAYHVGVTTAILVNAGAYGDTNVNQNANIVLQASATSSTISIASLSDTSNVAASITIPAGTTLNVGGDNVSTIFAGVLGGSGAFVKSGTGTMILDQTSVFAGTTEIAGGKLQLGNGTSGGARGTGAVNVDPAGTLVFDEPSQASNRVTLGNAIGGSGAVQVLGTATIGAIALAGTSTFTGSLTINGGQLVLGNAAAIGNPACWSPFPTRDSCPSEASRT